MTIHKSQGSQADEVTVLMPPEDVAAADAGAVLHRGHPGEGKGPGGRDGGVVRAAVERRAVRATGLARRLRARRASDDEPKCPPLSELESYDGGRERAVSYATRRADGINSRQSPSRRGDRPTA